MGSLLFTIGTLFFFPIEGLEDFVTGCRFYEVGSVLFAALTLYSELDRLHARRAGDQGTVTKRELLEQFLYCLGSVVFLVGTFFFDPPCVHALANSLQVPKSRVENAAALLFMIGSFMFSLGAYVNALSIFEAPRMFRKHLLSVTTSYMFGGLAFIAGTMGYVEAFEVNMTQRWCATWFYLVGCFFYVAGSGLSFVSTVARHQVKWERVEDTEQKKKKMIARLLGRAKRTMQVVKGAAWNRKRGSADPSSGDCDVASPSTQMDVLDFNDLEEGEDERSVEDFDLEVVERRVREQLASVLGPEVGRELVAAIRDEGDLQEDEDIFGAFWRSVTGSGLAPAAMEMGGDVKKASRNNLAATVTSSAPGGSVIGASERDDLGLVRTRQ